MSWEIVLFNSKQKIDSIENLEEDLLTPIDFYSKIEQYFEKVLETENHIEIIGKDYSIEYFRDEDLMSNLMLTLYGENALFEMIKIAKTYDWQIYDCGIDKMLNLEKPAENGYANFQKYLEQLLNKEKKLIRNLNLLS